MTINEFCNLLADNYPIYSLYDAEDVIGKSAPRVAYHIDVNEYRHYCVATDIYKCEDGYVGVTGPYILFNERDCWEDTHYLCQPSRYIAVPSITYKKVSNEVN